MRRRGFSGDFWPQPLHELLLQAALASDERARAAWAEARPRLDLPALEAGCFDVLPILYRRLRDWGESDDALTARLKGIYRKVWYANQLVFEQFRGPFAALSEGGITPLVFGPASLATTVYEELGLRRVLYFEALVRREAVEDALEILQGAGLTLETPTAEVERRRPLVLTSPRRQVLALHDEVPVDVLLPGPRGDSADAFWASARPIDLHGVRAQVAGPAEALMLACASGARGGRLVAVDWIADSAMLAGADGLHWSRVAELASERRVSERVREGLRYLREVLDLEVPDELVAASQPVSRRERAGHRLSRRSHRVLGGLPNAMADYLRLSDERPTRLPFGFARHLQRHWALPSLVHVPLRAAQKTGGSLRRTVRPRRSGATQPSERRRSVLSRGS
ncbi:MAG: nucleotidyltransferase family protein [Gaiellaceae bacterium]